jgi:hypothetical protein
MLILDESWFYFSTGHEITRLRESESPPEREKHMIQAKKKWSRLLGIPMAFILLTPFQKETVLKRYTTSNILYSEFLNIVQSRGRVNSLLLQTMRDRIRPEKPEYFVSLIPSEPRRILRIRQI